MEVEENGMIRVVVAGGGLVGKERMKAVGILKERKRSIQLVGVYDPYFPRIREISQEYQVPVLESFERIVELKPDFVIIAVPHDSATTIACTLLESSLRVLMEKPLGRSVDEARQILSHCKYDRQLAVGFTYRFFEGIQSAINDARRGVFGDIISLNFISGHGGDPNMSAGWKLDPVRAGGGCLLDPGIHILDLCRLFFNSTPRVLKGMAWRGFWKTGVEEECHILMEADGCMINFQVSVVRWRSTFRMEINGTEGYGFVSGRGKSYGVQSYVRGKRWGWLSGKAQADTEEIVVQTSGQQVFADEMDALFFGESKYGIEPCTSQEGLENMLLWQDCMNNLELAEGTPS